MIDTLIALITWIFCRMPILLGISSLAMWASGTPYAGFVGAVAAIWWSGIALSRFFQ